MLTNKIGATTFQPPYVTHTIDIVDGHGINNKVSHE